MKKFPLLFSIILSVLLCLTSCENNPTMTDSDDKISIVCTVFPAYDFARAIIRDSEDFDLKLLLKPGSEVHSYEPSPQDIIDIKNCDIFIYNGGESDEWAHNILDSIDKEDIKIVAMMDSIEAVEEEEAEGMQVEKDDEDSVRYDEHVWTSPINAIKITETICQSIVDEALSKGKDLETYKTNEKDYVSELKKLDNRFRETISKGKRKTLVFGDRFPFRYFTDEYDLEYYAAFPGCSAETEADAKTVAFLIDKVRQEQIPVVFYPELSNRKVAVTICESSNSVPMQLNSCHNLTVDEFNKGATYLSLMNENVEAIKTALY